MSALAKPAARAPRTWRKGAMVGGGYCNAIDASNGRVLAAGDVWGEAMSVDGANSWAAVNRCTLGIGNTYGRAVRILADGSSLVGVGVLKTTSSKSGCLAAVAADGTWSERSTSVCFSTYLPTGNAGDVPRAAGNLIAVDGATIYAATRQGVMSSTDGGVTWTSMGLAAPTPYFAWSALAVLPDGSLLVSDFRTGGRGVFRIQGGVVTQVSVTAVEDIAVIGGITYVVSQAGVFVFNLADNAFTGIADISFSGTHASSIVGSGSTLYVGNGTGDPSGRCVAVSTDGGATWSWQAGTIDPTVPGVGEWWLASTWPVFGKKGYSVSQLALDSDGTVYSAGRAGVWRLRDGVWQPAMHGLCGSEIHAVKAGANGEAWATDTDYKGVHTLDNWRTCTQDTSPPAIHAPALVRKFTRHTYRVIPATLTKPADIQVDGVSVADDTFRAGCMAPHDLTVGSDGTLHVSLYGGGVLVGDPA